MCSVLLRSRVCAPSLRASFRFTVGKSQSVLNYGQLQPRYASTFGQSVQNYMDSWIQSPIIQPGIEPVEATIIHFHSLTGNHWATDIVICTALVSLVASLPIEIMREHASARTWKTKLAIQDFCRELGTGLQAQVIRNKITEKEARKYLFVQLREERKKLHRINNSHPLRSGVLIMCDLSVWITYMFSLRNISIGFPQHLAAETYQQMSTESLGWIPCLTSPDPYMIIPVAAGLISLTNTEYLKSQRQHLPNSNNMFSKSITGIARTAAVILTVVLCYFPTNMSLYWMSFGILNLGKNVLIKNPSVKKLLRIPEIVVPAK